MAKSKKYKFARESSPSKKNGFIAQVREFFSELGEVISEQLAPLRRSRYDNMSDYERRREDKRRRDSRREKLLLAAILILPMIAAGIMLASCNCDSLSCSDSCSSCREERDEPLTAQEEEFRSVFEEAEEVYSWFTGCNAPRLDEDDVRYGQYDSDIYYRVTERGIDTLDELRAVCSEHFTDEVTDRLMSTSVYGGVMLFAEFDGKLYYYDGFVGVADWTTGEYVGHITSQSDTELVYSLKITNEYYSHSFETSYDYVYTLCEDGEWRFSNFELPAELIAIEMFGGYLDAEEEQKD